MYRRLKTLISPEPDPPAGARPVVVVSSLPRSGTSMMMKMLEAGGLQAISDGERTADVDNPKGYYEFERVKQLDKGDSAWVTEAQGKVVKVISALAAADCVIIVTDHSSYDWSEMADLAQCVVDTRHVMG